MKKFEPKTINGLVKNINTNYPESKVYISANPFSIQKIEGGIDFFTKKFFFKKVIIDMEQMPIDSKSESNKNDVPLPGSPVI